MLLSLSAGVYGFSFSTVTKSMWNFFFFQAEDGIRGATVTGVQTCALPILARAGAALHDHVPLGNVGQGTPELGGQRAVSGADLNERERVGPPQRVPAGPDPVREEIGEDGVHVGAGDEVPALADRRPLVEAAGPVQRELHELRERDRSALLDRPADRADRLRVPFEHLAPRARRAVTVRADRADSLRSRANSAR